MPPLQRVAKQQWPGGKCVEEELELLRAVPVEFDKVHA